MRRFQCSSICEDTVAWDRFTVPVRGPGAFCSLLGPNFGVSGLANSHNSQRIRINFLPFNVLNNVQVLGFNAPAPPPPPSIESPSPPPPLPPLPPLPAPVLSLDFADAGPVQNDSSNTQFQIVPDRSGRGQDMTVYGNPNIVNGVLVMPSWSMGSNATVPFIQKMAPGTITSELTGNSACQSASRRNTCPQCSLAGPKKPGGPRVSLLLQSASGLLASFPIWPIFKIYLHCSIQTYAPI